MMDIFIAVIISVISTLLVMMIAIALAKDMKDFKKIDVYDQVMLNFDKFADYVISVLPKLKEEL